jgi:predicted DNA-binding ribbon-helix-helix protein
MCEIYVKADPILYEARSRSVRIHGVVTSLRLENLFWDVLAQIAARDGMTTNQLIAKLYDELIEHRGEVPNLASFLRVSCMRYLSLVAGTAVEPAGERLQAAPADRPRTLQ